jgi:hypothetical protein
LGKYHFQNYYKVF